MTPKTLEKIKKKIKPALEELDGMDEQGLEHVCYLAQEAIEKATTERDANPKYQAAKEAVSDLNAGLKDVKSYQGAKVKYALYRLRVMRGEQDSLE